MINVSLISTHFNLEMTKTLKSALSYPTENTTLFMYQVELNLEFTRNEIYYTYIKFNCLMSEDCEKSA
jgi:hypothetical protein